MTWTRIIKSPVLLFTVLAAAATAVAGVLELEPWAIGLTAALTAVAAALTAMRKVTPVSDPRDNQGRKLTPAGR